MCDFGLARPSFNDMPTTIFWTDYVATRWYRAPELCGSFFAKYRSAAACAVHGVCTVLPALHAMLDMLTCESACARQSYLVLLSKDLNAARHAATVVLNVNITSREAADVATALCSTILCRPDMCAIRCSQSGDRHLVEATVIPSPLHRRLIRQLH